MTYNKPEIYAMGDAAGAIQGMPKQYPAEWDNTTQDLTFVAPAYDLDE